MTESLKELIELSKSYPMSTDEMEQQRRSFAYGTAKIENDLITKDMIAEAAEFLESSIEGKRSIE